MMFRNMCNLFRIWFGFRLLCFVVTLILVIITFYQLLITLFTPCFGNAIILLIEYLALVCLCFYTIFGF